MPPASTPCAARCVWLSLRHVAPTTHPLRRGQAMLHVSTTYAEQRAYPAPQSSCAMLHECAICKPRLHGPYAPVPTTCHSLRWPATSYPLHDDRASGWLAGGRQVTHTACPVCQVPLHLAAAGSTSSCILQEVFLLIGYLFE